MNRETYRLLEAFMLSHVGDMAHDSEHIRRVLYDLTPSHRYAPIDWR